jgi:predicted PurR-regulated permease PerM
MTGPINPSSSSRIIDSFIRLALLGGLLLWCAMILAPFTSILLWAVILAVALYPFHTMLARWIGGRGGWAATLIVLVGVSLIAIPGYFTGESLVGTVQKVRAHMGTETLTIPQLPADWTTGTGLRRTIADKWPHSDSELGALVSSHTVEIRALGAMLLSALAGFSVTLLMFIASIIIAGVFLANAKQSGASAERFLSRALGPNGPAMLGLAAGTIRNVAKGILGVAIIQTTMLALGLFIAGVPAAGALTLVGLMLAIVQIGVGPVVIGVIIYAWADMQTLPAALLTAWLVITTLSDNILKPILLGRGAAVPTVVIFLGAIGGFILSGIIGLFTGAVVLSIAYTLMQAWIAELGPAPETK